MIRFKPFFRRAAEENNEISDIWIYDCVPKNVRTQIWRIFNQVDDNYNVENFCKSACMFLRQEIGVFQIGNGRKSSWSDWQFFEELKDFFFNDSGDKNLITRYHLTVVELIGIMLTDKIEGKDYVPNKENYKEAIDEINYRLREARIGYQFNTDAKMLIKIDSEATYQLSIKPAFHLLSDARFDESIQNFTKAFEDYQAGTPKDLENAITNAVKALESTIRNICVTKKYKFEKEATLKPLVEVLKNNNYLPAYQDDFLNSLCNIFCSVGTIRNKIAAHGKEDKKAAAIVINDKLVEFVLGQTANIIVFLVNNLKK